MKTAAVDSMLSLLFLGSRTFCFTSTLGAGTLVIVIPNIGSEDSLSSSWGLLVACR